MSDLSLITAIYRKVAMPKNYVPRGYQTVGGMWPVDTWRIGEGSKDAVSVQLLDEGYTVRVKSFCVDVYDIGGSVKFDRGSSHELAELAQKLGIEDE